MQDNCFFASLLLGLNEVLCTKNSSFNRKSQQKLNKNFAALKWTWRYVCLTNRMKKIYIFFTIFDKLKKQSHEQALRMEINIS